MLQRPDDTESAPARPPARFVGAPGPVLLGVGALVALLILVAAAFLFASRSAEDSRRAELIGDALWVEQALRFAVQSAAGELDRIAFDIRHGLPEASIGERIEQYRRLHPELARVTWADLDLGRTISAPAVDPRDAGVIGRLEAVSAALKLGDKQYGQAYADPGGGWRFDLAVPAGSDTRKAILLASFVVPSLLDASIPWWVAQKNHVAVRDDAGVAIGAKSRVDAGLSRDGYTIPFDPPGHGLVITVTRYAAPAQWTVYLLPATIAAMGFLVGASLLLLQRSVRRRQLAEVQLRAESALRASMEDALTVGMRARDRDGRIIYANQAFCDMVGWPREKLIGLAPPMPYWDAERIEETLDLHDSILAGRGPSEGFEIRFRRSNGDPLDALVHEAPLRDAHGRHVGWMASILDVTERKRMSERSKTQSEELARTARLVSMGEMASTLAHEINQPLTAISTYSAGLAEQIKSGKTDPARTEAVLAKVAAQARRAGEIVRHLREFTRRAKPGTERIDLLGVAHRVAGFVEPDLARNGVELVIHPAPAAAEVSGDPVLFEQVILNLVRNAADAVTPLPKARRRIEVSALAAAGTVTMTVRDHGPGVADGMDDKLFTPFMSSKPDGMGMGLNICRSIVELHGGRIWHETARPGCAFRFLVPAADP
ncbi:MAG: PAS domain S-box protein [Rhizobiaceae bacterium]